MFLSRFSRHHLWHPPVDVYQTPQGWLVKVDLAGVRPEDVSLLASGTQLWIEGTRRDLEVDQGCVHYRMEIAYSRFKRSIELPCSVEDAELSMHWRQGMLLVRVQCPIPASQKESQHG